MGIIIKQHPYNYRNGLYIEVKVKKLKQNISDNIQQHWAGVPKLDKI